MCVASKAVRKYYGVSKESALVVDKMRYSTAGVLGAFTKIQRHLSVNAYEPQRANIVSPRPQENF